MFIVNYKARNTLVGPYYLIRKTLWPPISSFN